VPEQRSSRKVVHVANEHFFLGSLTLNLSTACLSRNQRAGTDANVTIEIFGENGTSGLQKINIGHDNRGFGASWFLDKVIITNQKTEEKTYYEDVPFASGLMINK